MMLSSMFTRILTHNKNELLIRGVKMSTPYFTLFSALTPFYSSCTLWLFSPSARRTSLISKRERQTVSCRSAPLSTDCSDVRAETWTHRVYQSSEGGRLQHQGVEHLVRLFPHVQQHCRENRRRQG